jgi:hypothetical protein
MCIVKKMTTTNAQVYHLCTNRHYQFIMSLQKTRKWIIVLILVFQKWVDDNYLRTFMYNDAQVNVLEEAL